MNIADLCELLNNTTDAVKFTDVIDVIKYDKSIDEIDKLPVAQIGKKIGLHDSYSLFEIFCHYPATDFSNRHLNHNPYFPKALYFITDSPFIVQNGLRATQRHADMKHRTSFLQLSEDNGAGERI